MRVASHLTFLRGCQRLEDFIPAPCRKGFQLKQLLADIHLGIPGQLADLLNLLFKLNQGFLEIKQRASGHGRTRNEGQAVTA